MLTHSNPPIVATIPLGDSRVDHGLPPRVFLRPFSLHPSAIEHFKARAVQTGFTCADPGMSKSIWAVGQSLKISVRLRRGSLEVQHTVPPKAVRVSETPTGQDTAGTRDVPPASDTLFVYPQTKPALSPTAIIHRLWARLRARLSGPFPPDLPLACFAARFDPEKHDEQSEWAKWPDALLWLPELLYVENHETGDSMCFEITLDAASSVQSSTRLSTHIPATRSAPASSCSWTNIERPLAWYTRVRRAVEEVASASLGKVVLARSRRALAPSGTHFDPARTVAALARSG